MLPLHTLACEVEKIPDRDVRHRARSLLACYLGYDELRRQDPAYAARAVVVRRALARLGFGAFLPADDRASRRDDGHCLPDEAGNPGRTMAPTGFALDGAPNAIRAQSFNRTATMTEWTPAESSG